MGGGTEAFPDLGSHCQHSDCRQLDFLPFECDACRMVYCLEHRLYKSHDCPKSNNNSRKVVVCEVCSTSIETTGRFGEDEKVILERHAKSGDCDPKKKKKLSCPVRRCKEVLTFSNTSTCKICQINVCLKHRFPADHACKKDIAYSAVALVKDMKDVNNKFLMALASRSGQDCGNQNRPTKSTPKAPSVKAC